MAAKTGAKAADRAFAELAADLLNWVELETVVAADHLAVSEVTSEASRRNIATDLNQWQRRLIKDLISNLNNNRLGTTAPPPFPRLLSSAPLMNLDVDKPLSPRYLAKKVAGTPADSEKGRRAIPARAPQSFFLLTGELGQHLYSELLHGLPEFTSAHVRPRKVKAEATQYKVKDKDGNIIGYRTQSNFRSQRGTFTKRASVESTWTVQVLSPRYYLEKKPELSIPGISTETRGKLGNLGGKGGKPRPYRPLLGPYLSWFVSQAIPAILKKNFEYR